MKDLAASALIVLALGARIVCLLCIVGALPLSFWRRSRGIAAVTLLYSSFFLGFYTWVVSLVVVYRVDGPWLLALGAILFRMHFGALGIVSLLFHRDWSEAFDLTLMVAGVYLFRWRALRASARYEMELESSESPTAFEVSPTR